MHSFVILQLIDVVFTYLFMSHILCFASQIWFSVRFDSGLHLLLCVCVCHNLDALFWCSLCLYAVLSSITLPYGYRNLCLNHRLITIIQVEKTHFLPASAINCPSVQQNTTDESQRESQRERKKNESQATRISYRTLTSARVRLNEIEMR